MNPSNNENGNSRFSGSRSLMINDGGGVCARNLFVHGSNRSSGRPAWSRNSRLSSVDGYPSNRFKNLRPSSRKGYTKRIRLAAHPALPGSHKPFYWIRSHLLNHPKHTSASDRAKAEFRSRNDVRTTKLVHFTIKYGCGDRSAPSS